MCNRNVLLLSLIVIGYLNGVRTESDCSSNELNTKMCDAIDKETNPCDDFYQFACGKYIEKRKKFTEGYASIRHDIEHRHKKSILDSLKYLLNIKRTNRTFEHNLLIDVYESCMRRRKDGMYPMLQQVERHGSWPVLRGRRGWRVWQGIEKTKTLLKLPFDIAPILKLNYDESAIEFSLDLPKFAVAIDRILFNKSENYRNFLILAATKFGAYIDYAEEEMVEVWKFDLELVKHYKLPKEVDSFTFSEMKSRYPLLMRYIRSFLEPNPANNSDIKFKLESVQYFEGLEVTLANTTDATIANYIILHTYLAAAKYSTRDFYNFVKRFTGINEVYHDYEYGSRASKPISEEEECFDQISHLLPMIVESMYINATNLTNKETRKMKGLANDILQNVNAAFTKIVHESEWMDEEARLRTIYKLDKITYYIADEFQLKPRNLHKIKYDSYCYLNNVITILRYRKSYVMKHTPMLPWQVSVTYDPIENAIYIPYGALQWPLFYLNGSSFSYSDLNSEHAASYFNYGALGFLLGHEIAHAIDTTNHRFGAKEEEYLYRASCFEEQYSTMETETGVQLNGSKTINEDISDNLGVRAAYRAYRKLEKANESLPGVWNYTRRQLFWISMAQSRCGIVRQSYYQKFVDTFPQTFYPYGVFGTIENMPEFTKDFNCPPDSEMFFEKNEVCTII